MLTLRSVALFYLVGLFDLWGGLQTLAISAGGAYAISAYVDSPYMPWIGFVFLMGHMSVSHISRMTLADPSTTDITGAQMVMVMKAGSLVRGTANFANICSSRLSAGMFKTVAFLMLISRNSKKSI